MTRAPGNLLTVRRLLLDHLNVDPDTSRDQDLEPAEVGIVGDPAHRGGYHCGSDRVVTRDYSVVESTRDSAGLTLDAAALDVGFFEVRAAGGRHDLRSFSAWCVAQCVAGTSDSRDIREIIYSPDGRVVRRWDRLRKRTSGDNSHLWHTHFSFFRDSIKANRDQTPLFRRYLSTIGLLEDGMDRSEFLGHFKAALADPNIAPLLRAIPWQYVGGGIPRDMSTLNVLNEMLTLSRTTAAQVGGDLVDEDAIVTGVVAGLDPAGLAERIAAALPADQAKQVADELARRLVD
ncbi:hypothetical protein [Micromonospora peucetia]|uniref:Uncharacterized protein n=1 Tax=Micromonospora peucetia TaxID=47871 RepID=A0A1C6VS46_9ACTN|nr:hypothetical protein [Micromonospora peucetia]WSA30928.1 hypothetical protein OIE14_22580 [Micromonospora peucetia]SCL68934.1 hypothetical protein GA0070608_3857 [Micromonospora peucetia]